MNHVSWDDSITAKPLASTGTIEFKWIIELEEV
jgi:hypothetical protein